MLAPRFCWLVLLLAGLFCLGDMRGDDAPKLAKGEAFAKVPDRLLKAIAGKAAKTPAIAPEKEPATGGKGTWRKGRGKGGQGSRAES